MNIQTHGPLSPAAQFTRIDVREYRRLLETGAIAEAAPYELLDGLVVLKDRSARGEDIMTVGKRHRIGVQRLVNLDHVLRTMGCHMQVQNPVVLSEIQMPEPDGAIIRGEPSDSDDDHFKADDIFCVIEVADSSLEGDRTSKLATYAAAGIPQYVLINIPDECVEVYELPDTATRAYLKKAILRFGTTVGFHIGGGVRHEVPVDYLLK